MTATSTRIGRPRGGGRSPEESRDHILDAAERCFAGAGIEATSMVDVADAAEVSRSLLYRHFSSRDEVVSAVLGRLTLRVIGALGDIAGRAGTLADLLIDGVAELILLVRADPVITEMFLGHDREVATRAVLADTNIHDSVAAFWSTILDARPDLRAEIRTDVSMDRIIDHVVMIGLALVNTGEQIAATRGELEDYLRDFLVPVIVMDREN